MDIRTVTTAIATDSAGKVVEAIPVREWSDGDLNATGHPVDPIDAYETANGMPVRYVDADVAQDSTGVFVDTVNVRTGGLPPPGYGALRIGNSSSSQIVRVGGLAPAPRIFFPTGA